MKTQNNISRLTTAQLRAHAALIRKNAENRRADERDQALAFVAEIDAKADLADAKSDNNSGTATSAAYSYEAPIVGTITVEGGEIKSIAHEWSDEHNRAAEAEGLGIAFQWVRSLHTPEAGKLSMIYVGTLDKGPMAQWSEHSNRWSRIKSKGNYGKNWACGGNWINDCPFSDQHKDSHLFERLEECRPELAARIAAIQTNITAKANRIRIAEARVKAAQKRVLAASQRSHAASYSRQADRPIYDGQSAICLSKADQAFSYADRSDAEADLILAMAGI